MGRKRLRPRSLVLVATCGIALSAGVLWWLTAPPPAHPTPILSDTGDPARGREVFLAGGCAACHSPPDAKASDLPTLSGGRAFVTPFGTFRAPNISPDPEAGIGRWRAADLARAMRDGVSPDGRHYYPAFPYSSYIRASDSDIQALWAYLMTLPASSRPSEPHSLRFPFNLRRTIGIWKRLYLRRDWVLEAPSDARIERGRYLVEALGHCGECHTPRNFLGGLIRERWLGGAPNPAGEGRIPNITPGSLDWSSDEILEYLTTGFRPDFDTAGGDMVEVIENISRLPEGDRRAIVAYLKAVSPVPDASK